MNLPNLLTLLRIFFVPLLVAALLAEDLGVDWAGLASLTGISIPREVFALAVFIAAAVTDFMDGYLARRWSQITTVGTLLDPIADKLLVSAALVSLVKIDRVSAWLVILIISREFAVSGLRQIAAATGLRIEVSDLGKTKMTAQVAAIALIIAGIRWPALAPLGSIAMWIVVGFTLISAADYFRKFWRKVDDEVKHRRRKELLQLERQKKRLARADGRRSRNAARGAPVSRIPN
ncbi:MAG: CDP-diacylglycerol--glycerol-3-phosphate 3-phosphatidyltransferase [Acidobacteriota bacterium]